MKDEKTLQPSKSSLYLKMTKSYQNKIREKSKLKHNPETKTPQKAKKLIEANFSINDKLLKQKSACYFSKPWSSKTVENLLLESKKPDADICCESKDTEANSGESEG